MGNNAVLGGAAVTGAQIEGILGKHNSGSFGMTQKFCEHSGAK